MTSASKVALIGDTVARQLFADANPVGQTIRIKKVPFEVIGLLEKKGQSMAGGTGRPDPDPDFDCPQTGAGLRQSGQAAGGRIAGGFGR